MTDANGRPRVALIQFPGSNCEWETKRAAEEAGLSCEIFRWNRPAEGLLAFDGYIIGGGFSYQDRVRSGVIATKEPIVGTLFDQVTQEGKPVLGICNGAQVLIEAGLVPGLHPGEVEMALAPNRPNPKERLGAFVCRWVYLKHSIAQGRCQMTSEMPEGYVWPVPIAHGEGRFTTRQMDLLEQLLSNDQLVFQYCDADGRIDEDLSINPNGAMANLAGLCNPEGNVLAMMPHPERSSYLRQIPYELGGEWADRKLAAWGDGAAMMSAGPGRLIFDSLRAALLQRAPV
ncbi:MAG TPA: phosphoribosylformylglycinamidine synthase I [Armatimonadota bacterium]